MRKNMFDDDLWTNKSGIVGTWKSIVTSPDEQVKGNPPWCSLSMGLKANAFTRKYLSSLTPLKSAKAQEGTLLSFGNLAGSNKPS